MKKLSLLLSSVFLLAACSKSITGREVKTELELAPEANQKAQTYAEWHSSKDSPDAIFSRLIKKFLNKEVTEKEICEGISDLSAVDLTLFEDQIRRKESNFILKPCLSEILLKLDTYWESERKKVVPPEASNKHDALPPDANEINAGIEGVANPIQKHKRFDQVLVVERDVSQGYFAVTGDLAPGQVALTFDDGPSDLYTPDVLKALEAANVKATFFVMGNNVRSFPENLKRVAAAGHSIGSHSNTHRCLPSTRKCKINNGGVMLSFDEALDDLLDGHKAVRDTIGWVYPFFRFPYGESSIELKEVLRSSGTGEFFWNVDSNDWRSKLENGTVYTGQMMIDSVMSQLKYSKRGIILNHDVQKKTAVFLPMLLDRLFDAGYQPVVFIPKGGEANKQFSRLLGDEQLP